MRRRSFSTCLNWIFEQAETLDFDFDGIAGVHFTGGAGGAGIDDITDLEGDVLGDVADDSGAIKEEIADELLLDDLAVETGLEEGFFVGGAADEHGAEGAESIGAFGAPPLEVFLGAVLPVAFADVVAAGSAEDAGAGLIEAEVAAAAGQDDDEFAFVVEVLGAGGNEDGLAGGDEASGGFVEDFGFLGGGAGAEVAFVIEADGEDFGRLGGGEELEVLEGFFGAAGAAVEVGCGGEGEDLIALDAAPGLTGAILKADVLFDGV